MKQNGSSLWWYFPFSMILDPGILRALGPAGSSLPGRTVFFWGLFSASFILKCLYPSTRSSPSACSSEKSFASALVVRPTRFSFYLFGIKLSSPPVPGQSCQLDLRVLTCSSLSLDCQLLEDRDSCPPALPLGLAQGSAHKISVMRTECMQEAKLLTHASPQQPADKAQQCPGHTLGQAHTKTTPTQVVCPTSCALCVLGCMAFVFPPSSICLSSRSLSNVSPSILLFP